VISQELERAKERARNGRTARQGLGVPTELTKTKGCLCDGNRHEVKLRDKGLERRALSEIIYWDMEVGVEILMGAGLAVVQGIWT